MQLVLIPEVDTSCTWKQHQWWFSCQVSKTAHQVISSACVARYANANLLEMHYRKIFWCKLLKNGGVCKCGSL